MAPRTSAFDFGTTNIDRLAHFWSAVEESNRPVTVISFGDSMADSYRSINYSLMRSLELRLGEAGYAMGGYPYGLWLTLTNGCTSLGPSALWFAYHFALPPGGGMWFDKPWSTNGIPCDRLGVFWIAHPGGGPFTLPISTNGGPWGAQLTLDGSAPEPVGRFTNMTVALNLHRLRLDGLGGTNYIVGPQLLWSQTSGVQFVTIDYPGISLSHVTNVPLAIRKPILAALNPDLLIWHMKEETSDATRLRMIECEQWWSQAAPNCDVVYAGTPWTVFDTNSTITMDQNHIVRTIALEHGRAYVDLMQPAQSYEYMAAQGYLLDGVHPSSSGSAWLARIMWNDLGFYGLRVPRRIAIRPAPPLLRLEWPTASGLDYQLEGSTNLNGWHPILSAPGDGQPFSTNILPTAPGQFFRVTLQPPQ